MDAGSQSTRNEETIGILNTSRVLRNFARGLLKKISEARRAKNRSFGIAQDRLSGCVLEQYVGER